MLKRLGQTLLIAGLLLSFCPGALSYPLTLEQRYRFKKYIPNTFAKLNPGRDPVHVVLLGDGNLNGYSPDGIERVSGDALNGFAGTFLSKLADEFFYTGGVRFLNPPEGGKVKRNKFLGPEIRFENLAEPNSSVLRGLQRATSDLFLNDPDLVIVQYGASDALKRMSMFTFRRTLHHILEECKKRDVEVIVIGPTPVNSGAGATNWGITRPYSTAAEGMAKVHGVMFIDAGQFLVRHGGAADPAAEPFAGMQVIGDRLEQMFFVPGRPKGFVEIQHLNERAHTELGEALFYELLEGKITSDFASAGTAVFGEKGMVRVGVSIRNQSDQPKSGVLGALAVGGLKPVVPAKRYEIKSGSKQQFTFDYVRTAVGKSESGEDIIYPLEVEDENIRFSFLIEDGVKTEFLDLPLRVSPLTINWKSQQYINITNQIKLEWEFVSGSEGPVKGTYRLSMGGGFDQPRPFTIAPLGRQRSGSNLRFAPPSGVDCFQTDISLEVEIDGHKYRFNREMEASRDVVLGEKLIMASSDYLKAKAGAKEVVRGSWSPTAHFEAVVDTANARKSGLYAIADLNGLEIPDLGNSAALRAMISVDARPAGRARDFGAVSPVAIYFSARKNEGFVPALPTGAFGEGYQLAMEPSGMKAVLKNKVLQIKIPQSYLNLHDWNIGGESMMGVRLEISVADPANPENPFPLDRTFGTHYPRLIFEDLPIRGMTSEDAQGLTTLRFSRQPVNSWSVRIY